MTQPEYSLPAADLALICTLQTQFEQHADPQTKAWFEAYLKGAIPYRGLKLPQVRSLLQPWAQEFCTLPLPRQIDITFALLHADHSEDKLAGILLLQEQLIPQGTIDSDTYLPKFASVFQAGAIADWSTCDWFCLRVLKTMVQREGEPCARRITHWCNAINLWQRRASCIPFVSLAKQGECVFPDFPHLMLATCRTVVQSSERFAQTAAGWLLRELWLAEPEQVVAMLEQEITQFSSEGLRYATEKMPRDQQLRLRQLRKEKLRNG